MSKLDFQLLDCTLRDGGYVNNWNWGYQRARDIIYSLVKAGVDVVEVGFLRDLDGYNPDSTVCNSIEELSLLLPKNKGTTMFSAMLMNGNYSIDRLSEYSGSGIEMLRVTAHDYDIEEGLVVAEQVKKKGYKISFNPINIMGYSDEQILWLLSEMNRIQPYQFSIVDTFGSMKQRDLDRIVSLVDNNLDRSIRVALHLHENMSLGCCHAQRFIDKHLSRPIAVDASLMGMGRMPGNLPIELIADYVNDNTDRFYDINYMMDAIYDHVAPLKGASNWGYVPAFFLSAKYNLHRNYAEHYLNKGDLTNRDINNILSRIDAGRKTVFDRKYADQLYVEYNNNRFDDTQEKKRLVKELKEKSILVMAPGSSIVTYENEIRQFIEKEKPVLIGVNFVPEQYKLEYAFFSNSIRFDKYEIFDCKTIITSNICDGVGDFKMDYNGLSGFFEQGCNSLIMLLKLLKELGIKRIALAGADGYSEEGENYYCSNIRSYTPHGNSFNLAVADAIRILGVTIEFLTPSAYDI